MMTPNSFQQVVAADDLPARKALSELGSAPLPPVAELEAALGDARNARDEAISIGDYRASLRHSSEVFRLANVITTKRRATGGND